MTKNSTILGIDISKDTFDVYDQERGHSQFGNDPKGFAAFLKTLDLNSWVVMEATGSYHHRLALYLFEKGVCKS